MPAHEGNPILPRRDRAVQSEKNRNPPVPRAPRAKARSNSCGLLARELKKDSANNSVSSLNSRLSESRRPANDSPFAQVNYARVNCLSRERNDVGNQVFEMGPKGRSSSLDHQLRSYERSHSCTKADAINAGMPWCKPKEEEDSQGPKGRRAILHHERLAAEQNLEWVPKEALTTRPHGDNDSDVRSYARHNVCKREVLGAAQTMEMAPMVQVSHFGIGESVAAVGDKYHGRRNILVRETKEESTDAPVASGYGDCPTYARKQLLPPCAPRAPGPLTAH